MNRLKLTRKRAVACAHSFQHMIFFMDLFMPAKQFDNLTTKYLLLVTLRESRWYRVCNLRKTRCSLVIIFTIFSLLTFTTIANDCE